jgi:hypothetical protein
MVSTKLKALMTFPVLTGCLLWSTFSNADSLIIRFNSGKTQQVTLKEPVDTVVNIQAQTTGTGSGEAANNIRFRELYNNQSTRKESDAAQNKKATEDKKNSYHLKWGAPKSGE